MTTNQRPSISITKTIEQISALSADSKNHKEINDLLVRLESKCNDLRFAAQFAEEELQNQK